MDKSSPAKRVGLFFRRIGSVVGVLVLVFGLFIAVNTNDYFETARNLGILALIVILIQLFFNLIGWAISALFSDTTDQ